MAAAWESETTGHYPESMTKAEAIVLQESDIPDSAWDAYGLGRGEEREPDGFVTESDDDMVSDRSRSAGAGDEDDSWRSPSPTKMLRVPQSYTARTPTKPRLRHLRRKTGTPGQGSPRTSRRGVKDLGEDLQYPLVLLHITLLPVNLPWSYESMRELLPTRTCKSLQHLESKISDTMIQRGLLIPHPDGDYDLLVERILETLELCHGRVTKCGHFRRPRLSVDSAGSDSGLGSSMEDFGGEEICSTCGEAIEQAKSSRQTWSVRIFAANGLMRRDAWAAAWREMESVDVEIVPNIDDGTRRRLEARKVEEAAEDQSRSEEEENRIWEVVEEQVRLAHDRVKDEARESEPQYADSEHQANVIPIEASKPDVEVYTPPKPTQNHSDIPAIYRPKDIPLTILLRNYIYLLAQDWRNVAAFCLALIGLMLLFNAATSVSTTKLTVMSEGLKMANNMTGSAVQLSHSMSHTMKQSLQHASSQLSTVDVPLPSTPPSLDYPIKVATPDKPVQVSAPPSWQDATMSPAYSLPRALEPHMCGIEAPEKI